MNSKNIFKRAYRKVFLNFGEVLRRELEGCERVLDLGCGPDSCIKYANVPYSVGVEMYDEYLKKTKELKRHNEYIKSDVTKINFPDKSFDAVMLIDVLEHLKKEDGQELILKMQKWAKKKVIILTPNGFVHQDEIDNNPLQVHMSGWNADDFYKAGFNVFGINGIKGLRGEGAYIRYKPATLWILISDLTQIVAKYLPKTAFHLFAIKKLD